MARSWFAEETKPKTAAREVLSTLIAAGLVAPRLLLNAFPEQPITGPAFVWELGDPAPSYNELSERLRNRWKGLAWTESLGFTITPEGASLFEGGLPPKLQTEDENHDLHLSAVFLLIRAQRPEWARHWVSDRQLHKERGRPPGHREKTPDALIRIGEWKRVVDFGGAYHAKKVRSIHEFWSAEQIPYELW